jgi:MFS family permease
VGPHRELQGRALLFLFFLWFLWFINFGVRIIFVPILPLIEDEFVISHGRVGSIFVFQSIGYGVSLISSGFFAGRFGYKKSILVSLGISSTILFLVSLVKDFYILYILSLILGFSAGLYLPSAIPLITECFAKDSWGKAIAIHESASSISILCTPFISLFFLHFVQWRGIFAIFAVVFLICGIVLYLIADEVKVRYSQKIVFIDILKTASFWVQGALWILAGGATLGVYFMFPLYLTKELSVSLEHANILLGLSRIGPVFVAVAAVFFIDRINLRKSMFYIMFSAGILTILLGLAPVRFIGVLLAFQAISIIGFFPVGLVAIAKSFGSETRGMATGLILTVNAVFGWGITPYLLGFSGDHLGFRFGFVLLGIVVGVFSFLPFSLKEIR